MDPEIEEKELGNNGEPVENINSEPDEVFVDDELADPETTVEDAQASHAVNTTENLFT